MNKKIIILIIVITLLIIFYFIIKKYKKMKFYSEKNIRGCDPQGCGYYLAPRVNHKHQGIDLITKPDQKIYLPFDCQFLRIAKPYKDDNILTGIYCKGLNKYSGINFKMFYIDPDLTLIGKNLKKGTFIGKSQKLTNKYPGITNHIHFEVYKNGQIINPLKII